MKEIELRSPKEQFLEEMREMLTGNLPASWDDEYKEKSLERTSPSKMKSAAYAAIPMICRKECPFTQTCPYVKDNRQPLGSLCPLESAMVTTFMADYIEQLDIDVSNWVEMSQVRDLVDQEIQMIRKSKYLAKEDFIQENVVGVDRDGDPIFQKDLHKAVELEDRLHKRRELMFKRMLATRDAKVKAGAMQIDAANSVASLVETVRKLDDKRSEELKRQLGIVEVDDYIVEDMRDRQEG